MWRKSNNSDAMYEECVGPSSYNKGQGLPVRVWVQTENMLVQGLAQEVTSRHVDQGPPPKGCNVCGQPPGLKSVDFQSVPFVLPMALLSKVLWPSCSKMALRCQVSWERSPPWAGGGHWAKAIEAAFQAASLAEGGPMKKKSLSGNGVQR